ncbi:MAG: hypothetical protein PHF67_02150 [Candidatus Nanoarchaeia archaeon]|nr:hypothetical protein [Candidatus Nanoarchaeia archaeon]
MRDYLKEVRDSFANVNKLLNEGEVREGTKKFNEVTRFLRELPGVNKATPEYLSAKEFYKWNASEIALRFLDDFGVEVKPDNFI